MFKQALKNALLQLPNTQETDNGVVMRCPFCGDSRRNHNIKRLHIKINLTDNSPIVYNCFNGGCDARGILTPQILKILDISSLELSSGLITYNTHTKYDKKSTMYTKNTINKKIDIIFPKYDSKLADIKTEYLNTRMGTSYSNDEWGYFKAILDLQTLMQVNPNVLMLPQSKLTFINNNYVSFISSDNNYLISRNITTNSKIPRILKTPLTNELNDTFKYYTIPNRINMLTNETITINIAEGVFDIIGAFLFINDKILSNNIYIAVTGSGFKSVLLHFMLLGFIGTNLNIFSDNDHNVNFYNKNLGNLYKWFNTINILYNSRDKDFGVNNNLIECKKITIKES